MFDGRYLSVFGPQGGAASEIMTRLEPQGSRLGGIWAKCSRKRRPVRKKMLAASTLPPLAAPEESGFGHSADAKGRACGAAPAT
jgi:hypothetical protein